MAVIAGQSAATRVTACAVARDGGNGSIGLRSLRMRALSATCISLDEITARDSGIELGAYGGSPSPAESKSPGPAMEGIMPSRVTLRMWFRRRPRLPKSLAVALSTTSPCSFSYETPSDEWPT